ncbi:Uncharacterised protein [Mycobacterium tuberculosis]|nr:Uncharacterised protein [Mycobacterium tuberculosis]
MLLIIVLILIHDFLVFYFNVYVVLVVIDDHAFEYLTIKRFDAHFFLSMFLTNIVHRLPHILYQADHLHICLVQAFIRLHGNSSPSGVSLLPYTGAQGEVYFLWP